MADTLALATVGIRIGIVLAAALAAAAVLLRAPRARAAAMVGALVLTPVLLVAEIVDTPQLRPVREHLGLTVAAAVVALVLVAAGAVALDRRPSAFPLAALVALPFRVPIEAGGQTSNLLVPLYLVVAAGALAFVVPALGRRGREPPRARGPVEVALLGFVVLYAVQGLYSTDAGNALRQVVFFYVPFALLFALLTQVRWTRRLVLGCLGVVVVLALAFVSIGFVEYATRHVLLNPKVIQANEFDTYFRVNSLFFDPNVYGRFLALVMLAVATVLVFTRRPARLGLAMAVLGILWVGLLLTFSQSSFGALVAGLAVLAALRWSARRTLAAVAVAVAAALAVALAAPGVLGGHRNGWQAFQAASDGRVALIGGGASLFAQRPLTGWGSGSFAHEYLVQRKAPNARMLSASHTTPITIAAEQGVPGLVVYAVLLVAAVAMLLRGARGRPARVAVAAGFCALVFHTLFYADFLEDPMTWALLGIGLTLARQGGVVEFAATATVDAPPARPARAVAPARVSAP